MLLELIVESIVAIILLFNIIACLATTFIYRSWKWSLLGGFNIISFAILLEALKPWVIA